MKFTRSVLTALAFTALAVVLAGEHSFRVTLRVVNDEGEPLPEAKARVSFERIYAKKESERVGGSSGTTDNSGQVILEGKTGEPSIAYDAELPGHYQTWGLRYNFTGFGVFRWQPWNPTINVVLKRIKNPVPMYAKKLALSLPARNTPVGYDFVMGDWVAPHGRGKIADASFVGTSRREGDRKFDWQLQVTFPNRGDGLQRFTPDPKATFRSDYEAPAAGYLSEWNLRRWRTGPDESEQTTFESKGGYYFRVRAELDNDGNVVKALYGKIYGDFFDMIYYLNPDGTRNVEFDYKKNLLKTANVRERNQYEVGLPEE